MGASLIGYLVKGPHQLNTDEATIQLAIARAQSMLDQIAAWKRVETDDEREAFAVQYNINHEDFDDHSSSQMASLTGKTAPELVKDFLEFWPGEDCRDACVRPDPDSPSKVIIFAGEMSWGDEPQGEAFEQLQRAELLGLYSVFEIS
jgi:hypothetical protein